MKLRASGGLRLSVIMGIAGGGAAVAIGAFLVLALFEDRLSRTLIGLGALGITLAVVIAMAAAIFRVVQRPFASMPPAVTELRTRRRAVLRTGGILVALLLVMGAVEALAMERGRVPFLSTLFLVIGIPILFCFYLLAKKSDRTATMVLMNPWVQWECDAAEWDRVAAIRQGTATRRLRARRTRVVAGAGGLLIGEKFLAWDDPGMQLLRVHREARPEAAIVFQFRLTVRTMMQVDFVAPLPQAAEAELPELQARLQKLRTRPEVRLAGSA